MRTGPSATERFRRRLEEPRDAAALRRVVLGRLRPGLTLRPARHRDIERLVTLTDDVWWDGLLRGALAERGLEISGEWSARLTSSAGNATVGSGGAVIRVSHFIVAETDLRNRWPVRIQGLDCPGAAALAQLIVEHELAHVAEYAATGRMRGHGPAFRAIAVGQFAHTEFSHRLVTAGQRAQDLGIRVGMRVAFSHGGVRYRGRVIRVNKRATVVIEGRPPEKFYVPIDRLEAASDPPA